MKTTKKATSVLLAGALAASMSCVVPALASAAPAAPAAAVEASSTYSALAAKTVKHTCKVGDKHPLTFKVGKKKIKNSKVAWKSSNKKIATVNKKGVITAKKAGTVTITGKYKKTTVKYKVTVKAGQTVDPAATEFNAAVKEMMDTLKKQGSSTVENGQTIWCVSDKIAEGEDSKLPVTFEYNEATKQFTVTATLTTPAGAGEYSGTYAVKLVFSDNFADKDCTLVSSFNGKEAASVTMKKSELNVNNIPELAKDRTGFLYHLIAAGFMQKAETFNNLDYLKRFGFTTIDSEYDQAAEAFNSTVSTFKTAIMEIKPVVENGETIYRLPSNNSGKYDGITATYGYNATSHAFFVMINVTSKNSGTFSVRFTYSDDYADKDCTLTSFKNGKEIKTVKVKKDELNAANIPSLSDDGQEAMICGLVLTGMVNQIANNPVATAMFHDFGFATIDESANGEKAAFDAMASDLKKALKEYGAIVEGEQNVYGRVSEQKVDGGTVTTSQEYNETTGEFYASISVDVPSVDKSYTIRLVFSDKYADKDCTLIAKKDSEVVKTITMKKSELKASAMPSLSDDAKDKAVFGMIEEVAADQFKGNLVLTGILMDLGFTSISE